MNLLHKILLGGALGALALFALAPIASAQPNNEVIWGGVAIHPGWHPDNWYSRPHLNDPFYIPSYTAANSGAIRIGIARQIGSASVCVDGSCLGPVANNRTISVALGEHNLELRDPNGQVFLQRNVDVVAGKTTEIYPGS